MNPIHLPGTVLPAQPGESSAFAQIEQILDATGGLTLAQVQALCALPGGTIQNWVKRGWVATPKGRRYGRRQVIRIILINMLRPILHLEEIAALMGYINGSVEDAGDDILPDEQLYDILCLIIRDIARAKTLDPDQIGDFVARGVNQSGVADPDQRKKLTLTLSVMVPAYLGAIFKNISEQKLANLRKGETA